MDAPTLIEPMAKSYLYETLKSCHDIRVNLYYYVLNIGILVLFLCIFGLAIYHSSQTKMTDYEKQEKIYRDQQYVLSKIRYYKEYQRDTEQASHTSITKLPVVNHYPNVAVY